MVKKNTLKFLVFADFHYKQGMYLSPISDVEEILTVANENKVDFILNCGDYCNDYMGSPEAVNLLLKNKYNLSVYGVYGNHELESKGNTMEKVTPLITNRVQEVIWGNENGKIGNGEKAYYYFDCGEYRIVCLDTNYSYNELLKEWQHNLTASWGAPQGNILPNSLGPEQLLWFEDLLKLSAKQGKKCIILSHATFNKAWDGTAPDADKICNLFKQVNQIQKGTVFMALNGHYHTNCIEENDGVLFFDVNTVRNGCWIYEAPKHYSDEHTFEYIKYDDEGNQISSEIAPLSELWQSSNTWYFNSPLYAVVTVSADGKVLVEGTKTEWIHGIVPQKLRAHKGTEISSGEFKVF